MVIKSSVLLKKEVESMTVILWLLIAAVFIITEIISLGLTSIWFAGGAIISAVLCWLGFNIYVQVIAFLIASVVLVIATRPMVKKYLTNKIEATNVESYIGKEAVVIEDIHNIKGTGAVFFNGIEWTARSIDENIIPKDTEVVIKEVKGVKLIVESKR